MEFFFVVLKTFSGKNVTEHKLRVLIDFPSYSGEIRAAIPRARVLLRKPTFDLQSVSSRPGR